MRLRTLIPVGVIGGAIYAARNTKLVRRRVIAPVAGAAGGVLGSVRDRLEKIAQPDPKSIRARQLDDEASLDDLDIASREIVDQLSDATPTGAHLSEAVHSPSELVEAERELLTAPGSGDHRRRRQTAGAAAQEIAAAQVRERRNGADAADWDS